MPHCPLAGTWCSTPPQAPVQAAKVSLQLCKMLASTRSASALAEAPAAMLAGKHVRQ